jgi:hypothetical protein
VERMPLREQNAPLPVRTLFGRTLVIIVRHFGTRVAPRMEHFSMLSNANLAKQRPQRRSSRLAQV